jgi:acetyltransferase-like isoleucine patch superfamily enzyme
LLARRIQFSVAGILSWFRVGYFRLMGVKIGKHCFISRRAYIDVRRGKAVIGNHVHISRGSVILSHTGFRPVKEGENTIIEDNVRIFVNSVILPGVRIGQGSIVGAGSVVMRDVPPRAVVQGNPARVIQYLEANDMGAESE